MLDATLPVGDNEGCARLILAGERTRFKGKHRVLFLLLCYFFQINQHVKRYLSFIQIPFLFLDMSKPHHPVLHKCTQRCSLVKRYRTSVRFSAPASVRRHLASDRYLASDRHLASISVRLRQRTLITKRVAPGGVPRR